MDVHTDARLGRQFAQGADHPFDRLGVSPTHGVGDHKDRHGDVLFLAQLEDKAEIVQDAFLGDGALEVAAESGHHIGRVDGISLFLVKTDPVTLFFPHLGRGTIVVRLGECFGRIEQQTRVDIDLMRGQGLAKPFVVQPQRCVVHARFALDTLEQLAGVRHLRNVFRADKAADLNAFQTGFAEHVDQFDPLFDRIDLFFDLESLARAFFTKFDEFGKVAHFITPRMAGSRR